MEREYLQSFLLAKSDVGAGEDSGVSHGEEPLDNNNKRRGQIWLQNRRKEKEGEALYTMHDGLNQGLLALDIDM